VDENKRGGEKLSRTLCRNLETGLTRQIRPAVRGPKEHLLENEGGHPKQEESWGL